MSRKLCKSRKLQFPFYMRKKTEIKRANSNILCDTFVDTSKETKLHLKWVKVLRRMIIISREGKVLRWKIFPFNMLNRCFVLFCLKWTELRIICGFLLFFVRINSKIVWLNIKKRNSWCFDFCLEKNLN